MRLWPVLKTPDKKFKFIAGEDTDFTIKYITSYKWYTLDISWKYIIYMLILP